jgi:hypothetical protein
MIRRTISSTTLFLHPCGLVILSSTWMHTNVTACRWFVELFRPQCCFLHPYGFVILSSTWMHTNVTFTWTTSHFFIQHDISSSVAFVILSCTWMHKILHVDDSSNYFVHNTLSSSVCSCHSRIHMDAYKCKVHADDSSNYLIHNDILHPCAFVIHLDAYKC